MKSKNYSPGKPSKVRKGLGPKGSKLISTLSSDFKIVFSVNEAKRILKISDSSLRKLLYDLNQNKWIERIEKGKYLLLPLEAGWRAEYAAHPFIIARKLIEPYYVGFWSALNYYGITEQVTRTTFIATTKAKKPLVFHAEKYKFVKLKKNRFFGFKKEWIGKFKFNISDKEKTIIDCLYLSEYSGGLAEVVKGFKQALDYEKLLDYALKMKSKAVVKRLGFILETLNIKTHIINELLKQVSGGYCLLDSLGAKEGKKNKKWKIIENIPKKSLRRA